MRDYRARLSMRRVLPVAALLTATLWLSACGSSSDSAEESTQEAAGEAPSMDEVKREAADLVKPDPGQYERTIRVEQFDVPGLPTEVASQLKTMMAKDRTDSFCLTKQESEEGFRDMFDNVGDTSNCSYDTFEVSGNQLDARMTCSHPSQGKAVMTVSGTAKAASSDVVMTMNITGGQAPVSEMTMKMHMVSTRTGDCPS